MKQKQEGLQALLERTEKMQKDAKQALDNATANKQQDVAVVVEGENKKNKLFSRKRKKEKRYIEVEKEQSKTKAPTQHATQSTSQSQAPKPKQANFDTEATKQAMYNDPNGFGKNLAAQLGDAANKGQGVFSAPKNLQDDIIQAAQIAENNKQMFKPTSPRKNSPKTSFLRNLWQNHKRKIITIGLGVLFAGAAIAVGIIIPPLGLVEAIGFALTVTTFGLGGLAVGLGIGGTGCAIEKCAARKPKVKIDEDFNTIIESTDFRKTVSASTKSGSESHNSDPNSYEPPLSSSYTGRKAKPLPTLKSGRNPEPHKDEGYHPPVSV